MPRIHDKDILRILGTERWLLSMTMRGAIPLLAVALIASGGVHQTFNRHGAATPTVSPTPISVHSVPVDDPRPVLTQTGTGQWTTTVLLTDVLPACYYLSARETVTNSGAAWALLSVQDGPRPTKALWDLVAQAASRTLTIPDSEAQVTQVADASSGTGNSTTASLATVSSCEVTLTFPQLPQVPETASLVFDNAGASFDIPLTVSRYMPWFDYYTIPLTGLIFVYCLALILIFIRFRYQDGERLSILRSRSWRRPVIASSAWTIRDSWATNITSGILVVGAILASTTAAGSLFPGVALNRFVLMGLVAGGIVLAAPAIFGILHAQWGYDPTFRLMRGRPVEPSAANNATIASLGAVLVTAAVTIFGIGAEIGTAIILVALSETDLAWQLLMYSGIALAAVLVLWYSVAAIRALILQVPGSILTSPSDTSFTL
jgi:hypothetical protein